MLMCGRDKTLRNLLVSGPSLWVWLKGQATQTFLHIHFTQCRDTSLKNRHTWISARLFKYKIQQSHFTLQHKQDFILYLIFLYHMPKYRHTKSRFSCLQCLHQLWSVTPDTSDSSLSLVWKNGVRLPLTQEVRIKHEGISDNHRVYSDLSVIISSLKNQPIHFPIDQPIHFRLRTSKWIWIIL